MENARLFIDVKFERKREKKSKEKLKTVRKDVRNVFDSRACQKKSYRINKRNEETSLDLGKLDGRFLIIIDQVTNYCHGKWINNKKRG